MTTHPTFTRRGALAVVGGAAASLAMPAVARAQTIELVAHYSMPPIFKEAQEAVAAAFNARSAAIKVSYVNPSPTYEDGAQLILRQAATGQLPDVSFQGLNRLRMFAERDIAVDLRPLFEGADPAKLGYSPSILGLGFHGGIQAGLAFATSNPISYMNVDLLKRVGVEPEQFPTNWDDVLKLSARIADLGDGTHGMFFRWPGDDWMFSALLYGHGGRMLTPDEKAVAFAGPEGLSALRLLDRMVKEGRMPNLSATGNSAQDLQAFAAGKIGMMFRTTAQVRSISNSVGKNFGLRTTIMPVIDPVKGRLPTGGAGAMICAKDPARRKAAFEFVKFATSAEGTSIMVRNTGYVPTNQFAIDDPSHLGQFYAENPLFQAATRQVPIMIPWYAFPGANSVRVTNVMVDQLARIVEQKATPEEVLATMAEEVTKLLPTAG